MIVRLQNLEGRDAKYNRHEARVIDFARGHGCFLCEVVHQNV